MRYINSPPTYSTVPYHNITSRLTQWSSRLVHRELREYRGGSPTAVQAWQPCPLWELSPIVTPYYCRLYGTCCVVRCICLLFCLCMHMCNFCFLSVFWVVFLYSFLLQYFDTVGWVFWPVKTVFHITYTVLAGTSNTAQSMHRELTGHAVPFKLATTIRRRVIHHVALQCWALMYMCHCIKFKMPALASHRSWPCYLGPTNFALYKSYIIIARRL